MKYPDPIQTERLSITPAILQARYEAGEDQPMDGDTIAHHKLALRNLDEFRESLKIVWETAARAVRTVMDLMTQLDPKAQARIRNGHPPIKRKPLLHNGRKP